MFLYISISTKTIKIKNVDFYFKNFVFTFESINLRPFSNKVENIIVSP